MKYFDELNRMKTWIEYDDFDQKEFKKWLRPLFARKNGTEMIDVEDELLAGSNQERHCYIESKEELKKDSQKLANMFHGLQFYWR